MGLVLALLLAGCSGAQDSGGDPAPSADSSPGGAGSAGTATPASDPASDPASAPASADASPSTSPSASDTPAPTEPGSELSFGQTARVEYAPNRQRASILRLTVTGARRGSTKDLSAFSLNPRVRASTPYYVDVSVRNVGTGDVGGAEVPVRGVDARDTLLPATTFTTEFDRCPSTGLPEKFGPGARYRTCLVFLAADKGRLSGVSFRPTEEFDPIVWTGKVKPRRGR